jgi:hypothetical protein
VYRQDADADGEQSPQDAELGDDEDRLDPGREHGGDSDACDSDDDEKSRRPSLQTPLHTDRMLTHGAAAPAPAHVAV